MRTILLGFCCWLLAFGVAQAQAAPEDTIRGHFAAIQAEDYVQADTYFSAAFIRAFKKDADSINRDWLTRYYYSRRVQLEPGYNLVETVPLADAGRETCRIAVDFLDPDPEAAVTVAERMYYYLIREKTAGGPLADREGRAWRIDICDAIPFDTLAEARRRPYLYTREAWEDSGSRELKSLQGLFQIHLALETFHLKHGQYPFRLLGGDNRRDELISGDYLQGKYPASGYDNRSMVSVDAARRSPGDFAYYSVDADGDGVRESYWLLLLGAIEEDYYFEGLRVVYLLAPDAGLAQPELAQGFAAYWQELSGTALAFSPRFLENQTAGQNEFMAVPPDSLLAGSPGEPATTEPLPDFSAVEAAPAVAQAESPVELAAVPSSVEVLQPVAPGTAETAPAQVSDEAPAEPADAAGLQPQEWAELQGLAAGEEVIAGSEAVLIASDREVSEELPTDEATPQPVYPEPGEPLMVYTFGW